MKNLLKLNQFYVYTSDQLKQLCLRNKRRKIFLINMQHHQKHKLKKLLIDIVSNKAYRFLFLK